MAKGGARPGAGRKPGKGPTAKTVARRAVIDRLVSGDTTPLDVMLEAMISARNSGDLKEAARFANMAAPYLHPRLANINAQTTVDGAMNVTIISEFPS